MRINPIPEEVRISTAPRKTVSSFKTFWSWGLAIVPPSVPAGNFIKKTEDS
jgi:hypothetical protein